ncbi:MAG TPA: glycosyltransferase family 2 protein [Pyrinomonadaceae bacterium]|nr:glycosyltransferase family 2 protein [Pyrinomonadaceae bacterium]
MLEDQPQTHSNDTRSAAAARAGVAELHHPPAPPAPGEPPFVSIVIPCFNEERYIYKVLENLAGQYQSGRFEIVVVDGRSTDATRERVADFKRAYPSLRVRLVDNPVRNIPAGVNLGIADARGDVIVRMDAHSIPSANYVRRCVEQLEGAEEVAVVGMPWRIRPGAETRAARAVALAVAHPFGIGDAKYRMPDRAATEFVDTVPFGVFRKSLWREVGGFNEALLANEDYDFHYRIRERGGRILLDTSGHSLYFARPTIRELARQYFRYGTWKAQMVKLHPRSLRWRHLVAPAFVAGVLLTALAGFWWRPAWLLLLAAVVPYTLLSLLCAFQLARRARELSLLPLIALIFPVLHVAWGSSFWLGLLRAPRLQTETHG